jgi:zinc D-Ala-D-Ala carboxypeptidase
MKLFNLPWVRWVAIIFISAIAVIFSTLTVKQLLEQPSAMQTPLTNKNYPAISEQPTLNSAPSINSSPLMLPSSQIDKKPMYGHFPYAEIERDRLITVASYAQQEYQRFEQLDREAALQLMKMIYAARDVGVWIVPVSGFRNFTNQELLFKNQIQKRGSLEEAAKLSAPPGYSEHHTGYAVDLADGSFPKQDITYEFEKSKAYKWLTIHAKEFGFEISFPANNTQGVSYEPWHWRFIDSPRAAEVFEVSRDSR